MPKKPIHTPVHMDGNSMPPSRSRYALDLKDVIVFPDEQSIPILPPKDGERWYILTEIIADESMLRPTFRVKDKVPGASWVVAFYTPNPWEDAKGCEVGNMICIKNGRPKRFLDGRGGYRIENTEDVVILPCTMAKLFELNNQLRQRFIDGNFLACRVCNRPAKNGCAQCANRYCSKECQRQDWPTHKPICKVLKTLYQWSRTDWG